MPLFPFWSPEVIERNVFMTGRMKNQDMKIMSCRGKIYLCCEMKDWLNTWRIMGGREEPEEMSQRKWKGSIFTQIEDSCDSARLRRCLNCPKIVILLFLQVNGKHLSVKSWQMFQHEYLCRGVGGSGGIKGKAHQWCSALEVVGPKWHVHSIAAGSQHSTGWRIRWSTMFLLHFSKLCWRQSLVEVQPFGIVSLCEVIKMLQHPILSSEMVPSSLQPGWRQVFVMLLE